jgi:regulator of protease activity HflC (stomatin/prohibitin superfamily)
VNPLTTRKKLSLRVRNFESSRLKVNERDGNPIDTAAAVVWRIVETFEAVFNVDDYENIEHVQSEAAVRNSGGEVADRMRHEIQEHLSKAGIDGAMLRRQQASAILAARQQIVEGAAGMVEMALHELRAKNVVALDEERKATMVSNLLVVLCSEKGVEPVVNTGTLYQ